MEWYWWLVIVIGVIAAGALKLYIWGKISKKSANKKIDIPDDED